MHEIERELTDEDLPLEIIQRDLEAKAYDSARKRQQEHLDKLVTKGREGDGRVAGHMINYAITKVVQHVENWIEETAIAAGKGRPSYEQRLLPLYQELADRKILAEFVAGAISYCFNGITSDKSTTDIAYKIASHAEHLLMLEQVRKEDKKIYAKIVKRMKEKGEERKRVDVLKFSMTLNNINKAPWESDKNLALGMNTLLIIIDSIGYFEIKNVATNGKTRATLKLTDVAAEKMRKGELYLLENAAQYEPMVVPPIDWAPGISSGAGYLTNAQKPIKLVKTDSPEFLQGLSEMSGDALATLFKSLNGIQRTGWRIRKPILDVIEGMIDTRNDMDVLPKLSRKEHRPSPPFAQTAKDLLKGWKSDMGDRDEWIAKQKPGHQFMINKFNEWKTYEQRTYKENMEIQSRWIGLSRNLASAERLKGYDSLYIPQQVDFRCRVYAVTQGGLSPQGEDYCKALLEFDEAKVLGERGWYWLRWHTANVWGEDKLTHDERVKWTNEHMGMIGLCAVDPLSNTKWTEADKPFQFLACCMEIQEAIQGNPHEFASRMPIALDGSCSGLQHLGMATRCLDTAKAVNLMPSDKPNDIYQTIADKVAAALLDIKEGRKECKNAKWLPHVEKWLAWSEVWKNGKLSRSLTKRPVMTYPYGSEAYGFSEQILEDTLVPAYDKAVTKAEQTGVKVEDLFPWPEFGERAQAASLMAWLIWEAVLETVKIPAQVMKWLQESAGQVVKQSNAPVTWHTPAGFPAVQDYREEEGDVLDCVLYGKQRKQVSYIRKLPDQNPKKHVRGIAPNVVHSLDATHLLMTVAASLDEGIKHIAVIHDSFGTHAADTDKLARIVREQMVKLYEEDYFKVLRAYWKTYLGLPLETPNPLPELPERGTFDIKELLNSEYAFA